MRAGKGCLGITFDPLHIAHITAAIAERPILPPGNDYTTFWQAPTPERADGRFRPAGLPARPATRGAHPWSFGLSAFIRGLRDAPTIRNCKKRQRHYMLCQE